MKKGHIPTRTCYLTREKGSPNDFFRIAKVKVEGGYKVVLDAKGKMDGRGMYVKKDFELLQKELNKSKIARALKLGREVSREEFAEIRSGMNKLLAASY